MLGFLLIPKKITCCDVAASLSLSIFCGLHPNWIWMIPYCAQAYKNAVNVFAPNEKDESPLAAFWLLFKDVDRWHTLLRK